MPAGRLAALGATLAFYHGLLAAVFASSLLIGQEQEPQRPPTFRTGTNVIRVDATVTDRNGTPLTTLTADDFEIQEDGKPQAITSFKFISADGQPSDDRSLVIRSPSHAASEAARDDVRTFLIFWDEYHIQQFEPAIRGRAALTRAVLDQFGPTDLVGIMDQLTPISAIELTRDRRALADRIHTLQGRMGEYFPPRSAVEEAHLQVVRQLGEIERLRTQVSVTAIKAAAAHMGTLSQGRKTLIVVSEALIGRPSRASADPMSGSSGGAGLTPSDLNNMAIDIVRAANDSNTAIHVVDPRGLQVNSSIFGGPLETIASGTGGDFLRTNDIPGAFARMIKQVSALYLLGYTREMPLDGLFHRIKVRVKRGGVEVRAREGYWAPRAQDVEAARTRAAAAVLEPSVAAAFSTLLAPNAPRLVDLWSGAGPPVDGRVELTLAWSPRTERGDTTVPASVLATIQAGTDAPIERTIERDGTTVDLPAGVVQLAITVTDAKGEVVDREKRTLKLSPAAEPALMLSTPAVHRSRSPADLRAILTSEKPPVYAGRTFSRTDRLIVRTRVIAPRDPAGPVKIAARLIDRRGATIVQLPVGPASAGGGYQLDLPVASIAAGEFAVVFDATSGDARAEAFVPFRVVR